MNRRAILPPRFIRYRVERKADGKWNKIPCDMHGNNINALDQENWISFEQASHGVSWDTNRPGPYGVGFVLNGDGWFCIDLDNCRVNNKWTQEAETIYRSFAGALGEVSMSGTGLHIFGQCTPALLQGRKHRWDGWKEFYTNGRFIALSKEGPQPIGKSDFSRQDWTSKLLDLIPAKGDDPTSSMRGNQANALQQGRDPTWRGPENDDELVALARRSKTALGHFGVGVTFDDLWTARHDKLAVKWPAHDGTDDFDHSSADAALMAHLAFWTGKDAPRMDLLFQRSALMRDKYEMRPDYRLRTITRACDLCSDVYTGIARGKSNPAEHSVDQRDRSVDELALTFVETMNTRRYWIHNHDTGKDYHYDEKRWVIADKEQLLEEIREFCRIALPREKQAKHKPGFWDQIRTAVRTDPRVATTSAELDRELYLLNTPKGTYDLRMRIMRSHSKEDRLTKITAVAPEPLENTRFEKFIDEVAGHDIEFSGFLQRMLGAALGGADADHWFGFLYGSGRNGKSLLVETIAKALGDYAITIPSAALIAGKNPGTRDVIAQLAGKKLVVTSEVDASAHFDEPFLKQLTGDEVISARALYRDTFSFRRTFKLIMVGNHRPQVRTDDSAMRERLRLCAFNQDFSGDKGDPELKEKLNAELGSVLQWLLEGNYVYAKDGRLKNCAHVVREIEDYFALQATVENWLEERTSRIEDDGRAKSQWPKSGALYENYRQWAQENGSHAVNQTRWAEAMKRNGYQSVTSNGKRYVGIGWVGCSHIVGPPVKKP